MCVMQYLFFLVRNDHIETRKEKRQKRKRHP